VSDPYLLYLANKNMLKLKKELKLTENCTDRPICITEIKTIIKKLKSGNPNPNPNPDLI
jgi:hypothetical protein